MDWPIIVALIGLTITVVGAVAAGYRWSGGVDRNLKTLNDFVREMREQFMPEVRDNLNRIFEALPSSLFAPGSPIRLTDLGHKVAACLEAQEWASRVATELKSEAEGHEPYQIDDLARRHVAQHVDITGEWADRINKCAFKFGAKRDELTVVLRIVLRDELLRVTGQSLDADSE